MRQYMAKLVSQQCMPTSHTTHQTLGPTGQEESVQQPVCPCARVSRVQCVCVWVWVGNVIRDASGRRTVALRFAFAV
jgi:hypothetical protein